MNYVRIGLAALGGLVANFAVGFLVFFLVPGLFKEARKHTALFRPEDEMKKYMPLGAAATLMAILVVAILFAMIHRGGSGVTEGARLGALIGAFVIFGFVLHNYANLNIGLKLTLGQAAAYFVQWIVVGIVIGLIYKPVASP